MSVLDNFSFSVVFFRAFDGRGFGQIPRHLTRWVSFQGILQDDYIPRNFRQFFLRPSGYPDCGSEVEKRLSATNCPRENVRIIIVINAPASPRLLLV